MKSERKALGTGTRSFRIGGYSVVAMIIVVAICVIINFIMSIIPNQYTEFDTSDNKVYTLSEQTKSLVRNLDEQVTVYWICQNGQEDTDLKQLLTRYDGLGSKLTIEKIDPDANPAFVQQFVGNQTVYNNSLVVVSPKRSSYVSYSDILVADYSTYYTEGKIGYNFDGESCLTSAISKVTTDVLPIVYAITGHGEETLSDVFAAGVANENIELKTISLVAEGSVPQDAGAIFINAPTKDLSDDEAKMVADYLCGGGNMVLITAASDNPDGFSNLTALMDTYGVKQQPGIVLEGSGGSYGFGYPFYVLPSMADHSITKTIANSGFKVMTPLAAGLAIKSELPKGVTVTSLLSTSQTAYLKETSATSYEKESDDPSGAYSLSTAIEAKNEDGSKSRIVWISCQYITSESINTQVSGGNQDFFLNCFDWMCSMESNISIHAKSVNLSYLTVNNTVSLVMAIVIIGIIPLGYTAIGVVKFIRRKRR